MVARLRIKDVRYYNVKKTRCTFKDLRYEHLHSEEILVYVYWRYSYVD